MAEFKTTVYPIINDDEVEVEILVDYDATYQEEFISGPPENCYPAYGELTINSVESVKDYSGYEKEINDAAEKDKERIENEAWEDYHANKHKDREEYEASIPEYE